jgi:RNA recognition motif-containing protein
MTTKKLYIGNLPFNAEEAQLKIHFEADGRQVTSVKIMMDRETGRSRGFAFVEMGTPEDAQKAITALHNQDFMGRPLTVNEAREQPPRTGGFGGPRPNIGGAGGGFSGPRPNGPGGPPSSGFGGGRDRAPGGFGGGGGGYAPPVGAPGFDPPAEKGGRANRDRGKEREKDRRKRGKGDDW